MKIGILGTRGIPNNYGGFEQWAEYLSQGLVKRGCEVYVYNSHNHPFQEKRWKGVNIVHCYDPEFRIGTAGQFIYDLNCILDSRRRKFDILLQLGYTSSSVWGWLLPRRKSSILTNMDGFEWQRDKFNKYVRGFLQYAEKLAVFFSDALIADSSIIKTYYDKNYTKPVFFIPYGASVFSNADKAKLKGYNVEPYRYNLLVARLESENNIEAIIAGILKSKSQLPLLIVGNHKISHGKYLKEKYGHDIRIRFQGSIYDLDILNNLRHFSNLYFHGHSVGGTNPSLLEAMASSALICSHDNPYNRSVLDGNAFFFSTSEGVSEIINKHTDKKNYSDKIEGNMQRIINYYLIDNIIESYYRLFLDMRKNNNIKT
ncbi:MAG: DUF1972 domain-containing protein [Bacteroidota bacterium]|nr:DUF1972 domain-containing protein [Bacteroidota bacterium]